MNIPCPYKDPCIDDANSLGNYSSEDPDRDLFRTTYFPNQIWNGDWDIYLACDGYCVSTLSQAEADLCAANNAEICLANKLFGNANYTCSRTCPDGQVYSFNVPYGTFWAATQAQANALARNWCENYLDQLCAALDPDDPGPVPVWRVPPPVRPVCNDEQTVEAICVDGKKGITVPACTTYGPSKAAANERARSYADQLFSNNIGCLTALPKGTCVNEYISRFVVPDRVSWINRYPDWEVFGSVPTGWKWRIAQGGGALEFYGTATAAGIYTFRVMATSPGRYSAWVYRVYTVSVMEIDEPPTLPTGVQDQSYSHSISTESGWDPKVFYLRAGNTLHDGLELTADGTIQGTPTGHGTKSFWIVVRDAEGAICEKKFTLEILPNFFNDIVWNSVSTNVLPGHGFATSGGAGANIGAVTPADAASAGGTGGAFPTLTVNNTLPGAAPVNCKLTIKVEKTNGVPPGTEGGITTAPADAYQWRIVAGAIIASSPPGTVAVGTYEFNFIVPVGVTNYSGIFKTGSSVVAWFDPVALQWVYRGGDVTWAINFDIIP